MDGAMPNMLQSSGWQTWLFPSPNDYNKDIL
jgi:hypothetical protein